jgi:CreA protein
MRRSIWLGWLVLMTIALDAMPAQTSRVEYRPSLLVQLSVANLDKAIAFYTHTLEFQLTERRDDLKFAPLTTNVPGVEFGLNEVPDPRGTGGLILNISVADVATARKVLEARGVVFDGATVVIPGKVSLAAFKDPDGNRLRLAGPPAPKQVL